MSFSLILKTITKRSFVESHKSPFWVLLLLTSFWVGACSSETSPANQYTILKISQTPDPQTVPYPNMISMVSCQGSSGELLIGVPAVKDRKILPNFKILKPGQTISATLIPWEERPALARASFTANEMNDDFDTPIFYAEELQLGR